MVDIKQQSINYSLFSCFFSDLAPLINYNAGQEGLFRMDEKPQKIVST